MNKPQPALRRLYGPVWMLILLLTVTPLLALSLQSCSALRNLNEGVLHPVTPEESKAQVVDAARDILATLNLTGVSAYFSRESCNDQAEAPFMGVLGIQYDHAATLEESRTEIQHMVDLLQQHGWSDQGDVHTHAPFLVKHRVVAVFDLYSPVQQAGGSIELHGECRDVTTQKNTVPEPIPLSQLK